MTDVPLYDILRKLTILQLAELGSNTEDMIIALKTKKRERGLSEHEEHNLLRLVCVELEARSEIQARTMIARVMHTSKL